MKLRIAFNVCLYVATAAACMLFLPPKNAAASTSNYVISDFEFFDYNSLSLQAIQNFLGSKPGTLANTTYTTSQGIKSSAEIIYNASREYQISPKVIIVTLQKEQSLIMDPSPSDRAYTYAMGYGCPDSGGCSQKAAGFFSQIDFATWQFRRYADNPGGYTYTVGKTYTIDSKKVTIENQATASLYNYTPHLHGNEMFAYWWAQWFKLQYPDGILLRAKGEAGVWLIADGARRGFSNSLALLSRGFQSKDIILVSKGEIEKYPLGSPISFTNYSLVQDENGNHYMIDNLQKRLIPSQQIFDNLGFQQEEVQITTAALLQNYADGDPLSSSSAYPTGVLIQNIKNGAIAYVKDGIIHAIHSKEILRNRFPKGTWIKVSDKEFNSFSWGPALTLKDGTLVRLKSKPFIYLVSDGSMHYIPSTALFNMLGFSKKNVLVVNQKTFDLLPFGNTVGVDS